MRIEEVSMLRPPGPMHEQLEGILLSAYLAEHANEFAQENENSARLYRLLDSTIEALDSGVDPDLAGRYFETWVLRLAGIFPVPEECPVCGGSLFSEQGSDRPGSVLPRGEEAIICRSCAAGRSGIPVANDVLGFSSCQLAEERLLDGSTRPLASNSSAGRTAVRRNSPRLPR